MKRWILGALTVAFLVSSAFAIEVIIDPPRAHLMPGETQAFTATAINDEGEIIPVDTWEWTVHPRWIGAITDSGLFTAGTVPGRGMVKAVFQTEDRRYVGRAAIFVDPERYHVIVRPRDIFLEPGDAVQYEAWIMTNYGDSIGGLVYDWNVEPDWLGAVTNESLFVAGEQTGRGAVIASTRYEGHDLRCAGFVAISEMGWGGIAGLVTNETGEPIPFGHVELFIPPHREPVRVTRTGDDGTYAFNNLLPGAYWVRACARGFLPEFYDNSPDPEGATPVNVVGGSVTESINFALALGGVISGTVTPEEIDIPIRRAHVTAYRIWPNPYQKSGQVDSEGNYAIIGLLPGTYIVRANAPGFHPEYWEETSVPEEADPILIAVGTIVEDIDFTLAPRWPVADGHLSGVVTDDSTGLPIPEALITLFCVGPRPMMFRQLTNDDGEFAFEHLPYGDYIVRSGARDYLHEYYDNVPHWIDATPLTVGPESSPEIAIALTPRENGGLCAFTGIINDAEGSPLEGVLVRAQGSTQATAETGPDGRYYLEVAEGEYVLSADQTSMGTRYYPNVDEPEQATLLSVNPTQPEVEADFTLYEALGVNEQDMSTAAQNFKVSSVYPNPFNATTRISFDVPQAGDVKLAVFDLLG
ncbi:carboxypeptidase-like regulatory domain-containing protein, partial [bacterium]|nr:carboxypeptidase-like regulatory domain-containing protein [bacterium]